MQETHRETLVTADGQRPDKPAQAGKRLKPIDIVAIVVVAAVIGVLSFTIINKLSLKHDVAAAQTVSDQVIMAIQKRDGTAARKLGTATFQSTYTAKALTDQFKAIEVATLKSPALERKTVSNGKSGRTVYFIYKYTALKVPYYIRTAVIDKTGHWQLTNISGNADETKLLVN